MVCTPKVLLKISGKVKEIIEKQHKKIKLNMSITFSWNNTIRATYENFIHNFDAV